MQRGVLDLRSSIASLADENWWCRPVKPTHTGAGEPVEVYGAGVSGVTGLLRESTRVCVLAEVPPDRRRQAMVASRERRDVMEVMFDRVAGLDVGKETVTVCLRTPGPKGRRHAETRTSFVPPPEIRRLRMLTRYRVQLMGDRRRDIVRLELMLEDASIKLSSVASSLKTVSARAMLTAMINGETDPLRLADLAKGRMRRKIPDLAQALTGHFDANHARLARSMLRRLDVVEQALAELDAVIIEACQPWAHQIELLQTIPGVGETVAQVIIAETGGDMSRFPTAAHLAAWAGLAPAMNESAGKQSPAGKRHGNKWLTAMLVEAGRIGRSDARQEL